MARLLIRTGAGFCLSGPGPVKAWYGHGSSHSGWTCSYGPGTIIQGRLRVEQRGRRANQNGGHRIYTDSKAVSSAGCKLYRTGIISNRTMSIYVNKHWLRQAGSSPHRPVPPRMLPCHTGCTGAAGSGKTGSRLFHWPLRPGSDFRRCNWRRRWPGLYPPGSTAYRPTGFLQWGFAYPPGGIDTDRYGRFFLFFMASFSKPSDRQFVVRRASRYGERQSQDAPCANLDDDRSI